MRAIAGALLTVLTMIPPSAAEAATAGDGESLFAANCGICHAEGPLHPGYLQLKENGAAQPALAKRDDLDAAYVKTVVRQGLGSMPPMTPTHLGDAELDRIAIYLAGKH